MYCGTKLSVTTTLTSLLILLTSCAGLNISPPGPDNQTLLVLPVTTKNTSTALFYGYSYKYEIVNATTNQVVQEPVFELPNRDGFLIVKSLPPGDYYVSKLITIPVGDLQQLYEKAYRPRHDRFVLEPGSITIFQKSLYVLVRHAKKQGYVETEHFMIDLPPAKKVEIIETLKKHQNFLSWKISKSSYSNSDQGQTTIEDAFEENEEVVSQEDDVNFEQLKQAAEQGDADAQYKLGKIYATGQGVSKNLDRAYMWWHISASQNHKNAIRGRDIIEEQMTPDQVDKALDLAVECVAKSYEEC